MEMQKFLKGFIPKFLMLNFSLFLSQNIANMLTSNINTKFTELHWNYRIHFALMHFT